MAGTRWREIHTPLFFELHGVKQVVWLNFLPAYKESLRHFGVRAVTSRFSATGCWR